MNSARITSKFVVVILLLTSMSIFAQRPVRGEGPGPNGIIHELNLTDSQIEQFDNLRYEHQQKMIEIKSELEKNRLEMKKMLGSPNYSKSDIMNIVDQKSKLMEEMNRAKVDHWFQVNDMLDESQQPIWKRHFQDNDFGRKAGFGRRGARKSKRFNRRFDCRMR